MLQYFVANKICSICVSLKTNNRKFGCLKSISIGILRDNFLMMYWFPSWWMAAYLYRVVQNVRSYPKRHMWVWENMRRKNCKKVRNRIVTVQLHREKRQKILFLFYFLLLLLLCYRKCNRRTKYKEKVLQFIWNAQNVPH